MNMDEVVKNNAKLIYKIATKFYDAEKEDLCQAGMLGLMKAYKNYKSDSDAKFSTFAYKYIFGEMYVVANKKNIKVNRDTLKLYKYIEKNRYFYAQELGHIPSNLEMSDIINLPLETIDIVCNCSLQLLSLDNQDEEEKSMYETIGLKETISIDDKILLYESLNSLPNDEKKVIIDRYFKDKTQDNIAKSLNTSQVKVSRLEKKGLGRIRKIMSE